MKSLIEHAQQRTDALRELSVQIEAERRVPRTLADELSSDGFYRMLVPKSLGGGEVHPREFIGALIALGQGDGATAWTVMTGATTGLLAAYLPAEGANALFADPSAIPAGVFAPMGRAVPEPGGYRLSGRWPFASGVENSSVRLVGGLVFEGDAPRQSASGAPEIRSFFVSPDQTAIVDTWKTSGLRGTGSHDLIVEDAFVPEERTTCVFDDPSREPGPLYRFPLFGLLAMGVSAVGLGIAKAALDEVRSLANRKKRGRKSLAETELAQVRFATAEAQVRAGEALMLHAIDDAWQGEGAIGPDERAALRLAATFAAKSAASAVDTAYSLGGGASIYNTSPLQRHFRDVHTMTQHIMVADGSLKTVGRVLLGLPTDVSQL